MAGRQLDEKSIFSVARKIELPEARSVYLKDACGDDPILLDRLVALLRVHDEGQDFLESPLPGLVAALDLPPVAERPGQTIGRYKLLEEIGEGGMGVVYMAEQQEPVRRTVALKVIKPGMDSRQVIARFEAERQALAIMDHPSIARVFDAGATDSGRPYFVMELVRGIPLTDYCDQNQLTARERLELFIPICHAVEHAHQNGIIHRDIKPSNVLVTSYDGVPVPKIIDFGIAKATSRQSTATATSTGCGQIVGTPVYMSPEQAELDGQDVDTRSDIYSLGVVLYELLTGGTPFAHERVHEVAYDEIRRMIREDEPPSPSSRISTLNQAAAATVSACRKTEPARLSRQVRGDLDWIVMKALEKDPARRYQTANDLARDIQRYLSSDPIEARPPRLLDRATRWVRMHRPLAWSAVASAMAGAILMGIVFVVSTGKGTVRLEFSDAAAARQCTISIDAEDIRIEGLGEPIKLRPGKHHLRVTHGGLEIEAREFTIMRHANEVLRVSVPAPKRAGWGVRPFVPSVTPDPLSTAGYVFGGEVCEDDPESMEQAVAHFRKLMRSRTDISERWFRWASCWFPLALSHVRESPGMVFAYDLTWTRSTCYLTHEAQRDKNTYGEHILINGMPYPRAFYTTPLADGRPGEIVFNVAGRQFAAFKAHVGLWDGWGGVGSVQFQALTDGVVKHETPVLRPGTIQTVAIDVTGAKQVVLRALNGGDGNIQDVAAWGAARFIRAGAEDPLEAPPASLESAADADAALFLAEIHRRLDHKDLARRWFDKAAAWMDQHPAEAEKLRGCRAEAAQLLEIPKKPSTAKEAPQTK
jgi:serine/threonine protein kinase